MGKLCAKRAFAGMAKRSFAGLAKRSVTDAFADADVSTAAPVLDSTTVLGRSLHPAASSAAVSQPTTTAARTVSTKFSAGGTWNESFRRPIAVFQRRERPVAALWRD